MAPGNALVAIFTCAIDQQDAEDRRIAWTCLDAEEKARAARFVFERDRIIHVVAHGLVRSVLARYTGEPAAAQKFSVTSYGRPELIQRDGADRLRFNLSHTHGLVACAVTRRRDIGLDVESTTRPAPIEIAERVFSSAELATFGPLSDSQRDDHFYALWTLKEAYIKARGLGLALSLQSFSVDPKPDGRASLQVEAPPAEPNGWTLRHWRLAAHRMALAVQGEREPAPIVVRAEQRISQLDCPDLPPRA
jgi:4'-phosphopantetheinyl transferase